MKLLAYGFIVCLFLALSYGAWQIGRKINYNFSYKSMVEETIKEMVKKECLN